jgi:hypothetical protein
LFVAGLVALFVAGLALFVALLFVADLVALIVAGL